MDGLIARACGSGTACLASLGLSLTFFTGVLQFLSALFAAISGGLTVWLLWRKVRSERHRD